MSYFTQVKVLGNIGGILDAVLGAAKPANVLQVGGNDGTNVYGIPLASGGGSVVVSGTVGVTGTIAFSNTTIAVTNAGTFAVQASWASAQHVIVDSGSGSVTQGTSPWVVAGPQAIGSHTSTINPLLI